MITNWLIYGFIQVLFQNDMTIHKLYELIAKKLYETKSHPIKLQGQNKPFSRQRISFIMTLVFVLSVIEHYPYM